MITASEVGFATKVRGFLVTVDGLPHIKINDIVEAENGTKGWVTTLHENLVEVMMLGEIPVRPGQLFRLFGERLSISIGDFLLGRTINPLGVPIDGKVLAAKNTAKGKINQVVELDQPASGIEKRNLITEQLKTGITLIDTLVPLGFGQRELVVGDARSGKSSFLIDLIANQRGKKVVGIYACIGKPITEVRNLIDTLRVSRALDYTIIVATSSTDIAPLIFLTPHTALTIAEHFQKQGFDVVVILDDLGNHAKIYREMSLLGNHNPGREFYPGDIFYQHAHLMERAGKFKDLGSITLLPVIELNLTEFTTFIPTNLMAMTDGHLLFKSSLYNQGQRPAVDIGLSVSRVGRQTQDKMQNLIADKIKQVLSQASEFETLSHFSTELPYQTQLTLRRKEAILELLKQEPLTAVPETTQVLLLNLPFTEFWTHQDSDFIRKNKSNLITLFNQNTKIYEDEKTLFIELEQKLGSIYGHNH